VADKRCENGHFIDESWDICPYCPQDNSEPEIPIVRPTRAGASPEAAPSPAAIPPPPPRPALVKQAPPTPVMAPPVAAVASSGGGAAAAVAAPRRDTSGGFAAAQPMERTVAASGLKLDTQAKRYVVGWLVGLNGPTRGESFPVRMGRNVIGRDRRSDIVITDDQASSHHADLVFRPEEKRFILMDHNSTNGTYVNETEIEPRRDLADKDIIRIGSHRFLFSPLCHDGFHWDDEGLLR